MLARRDILLSDRIGRSNEQLGTLIDQKMVLMAVETGSFFGLDDIGTEIWQRLEIPCTVAEICRVLADSYDADLARIEAEVLLLLNQMHGHALIEIVA